MKKSAARTTKSTSPKTRKAPKSEGRLSEIADTVLGFFSSEPSDIVAAIKQDHDDLRNFLDLLKDTDEDMKVRKRAYAQFSSLLKSHSTAEENVVYAEADELTGRELHVKIAEGYVEHQLANDLMKRIERCKRPLEWSAHANVLAEIVEHHLKEEERDLLPLIDKKASSSLNKEMLAEYASVRGRTQKKPTKENSGMLNS